MIFVEMKTKNLKKNEHNKNKQNKILTKSYDSLLFHEHYFFQNSPKKKYENQNLTLSELNPQRINKDIYFSYSVVTHNSLIRNINKHFTLFVCNYSG